MIELLLAAAITIATPRPDDGYIYRTLLVRAAPSDLLEVIDLYRRRMPLFDAASEERPFLLRHSQGDQWDLLLLFPIGDLSEYFAPDRVERWTRVAEEAGRDEESFLRELNARVAWREEVFVEGPPLDVVKRAFSEASFYHIEMFIALPGKRAELLDERRMENDYLRRIDRPQNLIFTRVAGAAWDLYTIGFYRDIEHFAQSAEIPDARKEAAAKAAGFEGASLIGTYLRTLIQSHHDTLASAALAAGS